MRWQMPGSLRGRWASLAPPGPVWSPLLGGLSSFCPEPQQTVAGVMDRGSGQGFRGRGCGGSLRGMWGAHTGCLQTVAVGPS